MKLKKPASFIRNKVINAEQEPKKNKKFYWKKYRITTTNDDYWCYRIQAWYFLFPIWSTVKETHALEAAMEYIKRNTKKKKVIVWRSDEQ